MALTGTITDIPQAPLLGVSGGSYAQFSASNTFELTAASTYPDSTPGDWIQAAASAVDEFQDVIFQKQVVGRSGHPISAYGFTGVTGFSGTTSNPTRSFNHFNASENDGSTINWALLASVRGEPQSGNLPVPFGASSTLVACAPGGVAIPNCGESWTVTPPKAGAQGLHLWIVAFDTPTLTITATQTDGKVYTGTIGALAASGYTEKVVDIALNTPVPNSPVVLTVKQTGTPTTTDSTFGVKAIAVGGATNGGVDPTTISTIYNGGLGGTVGARTFQVDPPTRIPASTTTIRLCSAAVTTGCVTEGL